MNAFRRGSMAAKHMMKHKTMAVAEEEKDEAHEAAMDGQKMYEGRIKTLAALTLDARAQLAEAFFQLGNNAQCLELMSHHELDPSAAKAALGLPMNTGEETRMGQERMLQLIDGAARAKVVAGMLQEAFHNSFGAGLQEALLTPLDAEMELFDKTKELVAARHAAVLDASHYRDKVAKLGASTKEKERAKLEQNQAKSADATAKADEAKRALETALAAHDAARKDLVTKRVAELKGMLHRFCELAGAGVFGARRSTMSTHVERTTASTSVVRQRSVRASVSRTVLRARTRGIRAEL
mmetsp:Transcript_21280/g.63554  ORF Transcript_21280/g.63554 Transcript_21280/m.63554 type:complete len:296 (-) Transcript_21280:53-940(-)